MMRRQHRGFSLIEILCVVAIIAILVGLAVANWSLTHEKARKAEEFHKESTRRTNDAMTGNPEDNRRP